MAKRQVPQNWGPKTKPNSSKENKQKTRQGPPLNGKKDTGSEESQSENQRLPVLDPVSKKFPPLNEPGLFNPTLRATLSSYFVFIGLILLLVPTHAHAGFSEQTPGYCECQCLVGAESGCMEFEESDSLRAPALGAACATWVTSFEEASLRVCDSLSGKHCLGYVYDDRWEPLPGEYRCYWNEF